MTNSTEEFVSNFQSITGETVPERRKHFRILLTKTRQTLKNGSEEIDFSFLRPKNVFEEILKVEAVIYFRKVSDLLKILKSENPVHIAKVLKVSSTFLSEAFGKINGEELVEQIFPLLSFNTKLKLVNKLALHLNNILQAEEFFEAIRQNYGLHLASKLLPGCSVDFIIKSIKTYRIEITPAQLMIIVKKYPELTETILEKLHNCNNKIGVAEKYKIVFIYLLQSKPLLFLKLKEKYNPDLHVGRRLTKSFICGNKQTVIDNSKKIYKLLKSREVFRNLNQDFNEFYFNLFPRTLGQCEEEYGNLLSLLKHTPSDWRKVNLLAETFKKVYGSELWDYPQFITPNLIEALSPEDREVWMQTHSKPKEILEEKWISYMKLEKSLPLLKERISLTFNIKARAKLIVHLVTTCKFNKDKAALVDVCKYMMAKHHNDHYRVRQGFLTTVKSCFGLEQLEEDHWVHILELIDVGIFNNENFYKDRKFLRAYIKYRLNKNLPVEEQLTCWVKFRYYDLTFDDPKYEAHLLPLLGNVVGFGRKDSELRYAHVSYLSTLSCWNKKHPQHHVSLLPYTNAINYFKSSLKSGEHSWESEKILFQLLQQPSISEIEKVEMLTDFFTCTDSWISVTMFKWLLVNKPTYILNNTEIIADAILKVSPFQKTGWFWMQLQNYTFLGIPEKICKVFMEKVRTKQVDIHPDRFKREKLKGAVTALSCLMKATDFINFISPYYPSKLTADIQSEEGLWMCKVHEAVGASIRNITPSRALESVLHFCKGDYLKLVQRSLYSVSQNIAECKVSALLNELSSRAVSVRKHYIYLTVIVSKKNQILEMFKKLVITEKNSSVRKCLFKGAFNSFINYSDDCFWELLKETVILLDANDNEAFKVLTKWRRIPRNYLQLYIAFTWDVLDSQLYSSEGEEKLFQILDAMTSEVIPVLPTQFCTSIIEKYLFKSTQSTNFQVKIMSFTSRCIIYPHSEVEQKENLKFTFSLLKTHVRSSWCDAKSCIFGRKSVYSFITNFCSEFLEKKSSNVKIFRVFVDSWNHFLKAHEDLNAYLYLQFTLIHLENSTLLKIGEQLVKLHDSLLSQNGISIAESFDKTVKLFLKHYLLSDVADLAEENRYVLMENIMKNSESTNRLIIIISLLPDKIPSSIKMKCKYESIIGVLLKEQEPTVNIYLNKYIQQSLEQ